MGVCCVCVCLVPAVHTPQHCTGWPVICPSWPHSPTAMTSCHVITKNTKRERERKPGKTFKEREKNPSSSHFHVSINTVVIRYVSVSICHAMIIVAKTIIIQLHYHNSYQTLNDFTNHNCLRLNLTEQVALWTVKWANQKTPQTKVGCKWLTTQSLGLT